MKITARLSLFLACAFSLAAQPASKPAKQNILFEGTFAEIHGGVPAGWHERGFAGTDHGNSVKSTPDRDGNYVSLFIPSLAKGNFTLELKEPVILNPAWSTLLCSYDIRVFKFTQGSEGYHKPRMHLTFLDAEGKELSSTGVSVPGSLTDAWQTAERRVSIPAGASSVKVWIGTFSSQGQLDFRNLYIAPAP